MPVDLWNDVAVLRLTSPLKLSSTVAPVKLNEDAACPKEGQMCTIAGWGLDGEEDAGEDGWACILSCGEPTIDLAQHRKALGW